LVDTQERLETTLRLRIEAMLHAEPAPEAVTFDTLVDPTTDEVVVRPGHAG
jgi:type VI secretion system protein ImpF